jgi:hypothetical protein
LEYQREHTLKTGDPIPWDEIIGPNRLFEAKPVCPSGGTLSFSETFPEKGKCAVTCDQPGHQCHDAGQPPQ